MATSGIGLWYGHSDSNQAVLEDLLKDDDYDWDVTQEELDAGDYGIPESVVARLPMVLADARPFPANLWDANGYYTG